MDNILVDDVSLKKEIENLHTLLEKMHSITSQLSLDYASARSGLDEALQRDIDAYIQAADSYNRMIQDFVEKNISALEERLRKLQDYNQLSGN